MNVLFVCHRFPYPPKRGGKIRPFNIIRHLTEQGHRVTVASLTRSPEESREGEGLAEHCHEILSARVAALPQTARMVARLPTPTPSSMGYFYSPELAAAVRRTLARQRFDLTFVHCSSVAQYVMDAPGPKILDFGDMDSQKWRIYAKLRRLPLSLGYWLEGAKLEREEKRLARHFDLCTCTTRLEWRTLEDYATGTPTDWFPNGVDYDFFAPGDEPYDPDTLCFIGRMDYYPNQQCMFDFCADTLPRIQAQRPSTKLLIVGADPSPKVRALGSLPGVTVTGSVPDVRPFVRRAAAMVAPLRIARGTQNKILEAMAMGVPVVTSRLAAQGVDAVAGEHLLAGDTPEEVAAALLGLLDDPGQRRRLAQAGRARVISHHDWSRSMERLDGIIRRCLSAGPGRDDQVVTSQSEAV